MVKNPKRGITEMYPKTIVQQNDQRNVTSPTDTTLVKKDDSKKK